MNTDYHFETGIRTTEHMMELDSSRFKTTLKH